MDGERHTSAKRHRKKRQGQQEKTSGTQHHEAYLLLALWDLCSLKTCYTHTCSLPYDKILSQTSIPVFTLLSFSLFCWLFAIKQMDH